MFNNKFQHKHHAYASRFDFIRRSAKIAGITLVAVLLLLVSLPTLLILSIQHDQNASMSATIEQFPVTVDARNKTITQNSNVDAYLNGANSPLQASVLSAVNPFVQLAESAILAIAESQWYQSLASVVSANNQIVTIPSGMRKEQVSDIFAKSLSWNNEQKLTFLTAYKGSALPLPEGSFFPGTYIVSDSMTPTAVQTLVNTRFTDNILAHYGTTTADQVPINEALTIASIIQRETIDNNDMRLISGIIWNRIFIGMNLQVDATLQYSKASANSANGWWPTVIPKDKYIDSPYNTYLHAGLPPTPISSPSVGAVVAALNPLKTTCLYYFNDKEGNFHCSDTYVEQVALLKKYYGTK